MQCLKRVQTSGSTLWLYQKPLTTTHKEEAEKFINFMCRPDIALMNAEYIGYSTANDAAVDMMDEEIQNDPLRYPDLSTLQNMEVFTYDKELSRKISDIWLQFKIG